MILGVTRKELYSCCLSGCIRILIALVPNSSRGCETAEIWGLVKDSTTGPSNVIKETSLPIFLFNSTQAWITPTLEYSVEQMIHLRSGLFLRRSKSNWIFSITSKRNS